MLLMITFDGRLLRSAKWRRAPASESQKQLLAKRRGIINHDGDELEQGLSKLTKGEAANIITRLKHGAKVREVKCHMSCQIDIDFDPEKVR
jgi:ATP-dependent helicase IRC3